MDLKAVFSEIWNKKPNVPPPTAEKTPLEQPVVDKSFLDDEIAWIERIDAIPAERMRAYVEKEFSQLPVLTRAKLMPQIPLECRPAQIVSREVTRTVRRCVDTLAGPRMEERQEPVEIDAGMAGRLFYLLGHRGVSVYSGDLTVKDDVDRALLALYGQDHDRAWKLCQEHEERIKAVKKESEAAQEAAFAEYEAHYKTLPEEQRPVVNYMLARKGASRGQSGFHFMAPRPSWPFSVCGWARTEPVNGVSFAIGRECFPGRDPLLFYVEEKIEGGESLEEAAQRIPGWAEKIYYSIQGYSSGIRLVGRYGPVILFRLDETKIKKLDILYGGPAAAAQPDYIFTWLGAGEFQCTLGEVINRRLIPLHRDDFCMK